MASPTTTDAPALQTLLQSWEKGLRTLAMYLPNNPVRQQTIEALQEGLTNVWQELPLLALGVTEAGLEWESQIVLPIGDKSESLAWTLFGDGIRWISFSPGVETEEIVTFLGIIQQARTLTDEDEDDLRTLLWSADFRCIRYKVAQPEQGGVEPIEATAALDLPPRPEPEQVRGSVEEDLAEEGGNGEGATPGPKGPVNMADFESTLYFLDTQEIDYLKDEVRREYEQNLNENVLSMLYDIFEAQSEAGARAEVISILSDLLPNLLNSGDFHSVAYLISNEDARQTMTRAVARMAEGRPAAVGVALKSSERVVVIEALRLVAERGLRGVGEQLVGLVEQDDLGIRAALVPALAAAPTSQTMEALVKLIDDLDPDVRIAAVKALGVKRFQGAVPALEEVVLGKEIRSRDLTERRAFFESYGTIAGQAGVTKLRDLLLSKGFGRRVDPDTRACAAMALGRVPLQEARVALQKATKDRDPVVRSAALRALQKGGR